MRAEEAEYVLSQSQPSETELVRELTAIVRQADEEFEAMGGTSRHWVRDHFLPLVRAHGYRIVKVPAS